MDNSACSRWGSLSVETSLPRLFGIGSSSGTPVLSGGRTRWARSSWQQCCPWLHPRAQLSNKNPRSGCRLRTGSVVVVRVANVNSPQRCEYQRNPGSPACQDPRFCANPDRSYLEVLVVMVVSGTPTLHFNDYPCSAEQLLTTWPPRCEILKAPSWVPNLDHSQITSPFHKTESYSRKASSFLAHKNPSRKSTHSLNFSRQHSAPDTGSSQKDSLKPADVPDS